MAAVAQNSALRLISLYSQHKAIIEQAVIDQGLGWDATKIDQMTTLAVEQDMQRPTSGISNSFSAMTKFTGQAAPETFIDTFDAECSFFGLHDDAQKFSIFPSLMSGSKATAAQSHLRSSTDWDAMKQVFIDYFKVDVDIVESQLKGLRVIKWDVEAYTNDFNNILVKYPGAGNQQRHLKDIFTSALPYELRKHLLLDANTSRMSLVELQNEAIRRQKTMSYLMFSSKNQESSGDTDSQNKRNDNRTDYKKENAKQYNKEGKAAMHTTNVAQLFQRMHVTNLGESEKQLNDTNFDVTGTSHTLARRTLSRSSSPRLTAPGAKVLQTSKSRHQLQVTNSSRNSEQCKLADSTLELVAEQVVQLYTVTDPTAEQVKLQNQAFDSVLAHLERQDRGVQAGPRKVSARDLMNEAERILHKTAGNLTLFDRLAGDEELRHDMIDLLRELEYQSRPSRAPQITPDAYMDDAEASGLRSVPVQVTRLAANASELRGIYSPDDLLELQKYYGAHPDLLDGLWFLRNREAELFLNEVTGSATDLSTCSPVLANIPFAPVRIGKYKVRAIIDPGSTSTIISTSLLNKMPDIAKTLEPTTMTFSGVNDGKHGYAGVIPALPLQLAPTLKTTIRVAVVDNPEPYLLLGEDVYGGHSAKYEMVSWNSHCHVITLADKSAGVIGTLQYVRNIEFTGLPTSKMASADAASSLSGPRVAKLFRH